MIRRRGVQTDHRVLKMRVDLLMRPIRIWKGTHVGGPKEAEVWSRMDKVKNRGRVFSLDQAVRERGFSKPNCIKLDVEGTENAALKHVD
jgi:FkbM family methyltransferase